MSCVCHSSFHSFTVEHKTPVPFFVMNSNETRNQILDETFKLFLVNNWETITIEKIEHQMGRTRGAIFYFFKNKKNLFEKVIDERLCPCLALSDHAKCQIENFNMTDFALNYHSPLDRIRLKAASLGVKVSTSEVVGAILQAMKISPDFKIKMKASLLEEMKVVDNVFRKCYAASSVKVCTDSLFVDKLGIFLLNAFL